MKKLLSILLLVSISCIGAMAQVSGELLKITQYNFGIGTARSSAMGGAFTSLGADIASMSINPAGLGMYTRGEVGITPQLRFSQSRTGYINPTQGLSIAENRDNKNRAMVGSFGIAVPLDNFAIGFGYNRLASFHSRSTGNGLLQGLSIRDMFAAQMNGIDRNNLLGDDDFENMEKFFNISPNQWGGVLGYQTWAIDHMSDDEYFANIPLEAILAPFIDRSTKGYIDEFDFSMSYSIGDLHLGATIGVQSIRYDQSEIYRELIYNEEPYMGQCNDFQHKRALNLKGTGINLKIGAIYRPTNWLRLGVSYHSPTWITLDEEYTEEMFNFMPDLDDRSFYQITPLYINKYKVRSSSRFLAGASFMITNRAIISVDYKRSWPDKMRYKQNFGRYNHRPTYTSTPVDDFHNYYMAHSGGSPYNTSLNINDFTRQSYRAVNNYSIGAEIFAGEGVYIRGGYMYQTSPYRDGNILEPDGSGLSAGRLNEFERIHQWSAGVGYRESRFSIDLTYVNSRTKHLPYKYFSLGAYYPEGWATSRDITQYVMLGLAIRL